MRQSYTPYKKSYIKGNNSYWNPKGLTKKELQVFRSGKLPTKMKILVDKTFRGRHALFSGVIGYIPFDVVQTRTRTWVLYRLPKTVNRTTYLGPKIYES
jgi:hypothetical protein